MEAAGCISREKSGGKGRALENRRRERGRPRNIANRLLAESLDASFKAFGGRIARRQTPIDVQGGGVLYVESGPFSSFLERVIGPLQAHPHERHLPGVTIQTIERIASEQFAQLAESKSPFSPTRNRLPASL